MKTVTYTVGARRAYQKLPDEVRARIEAKLHRYAATGEGSVKALSGRSGARLRVGDYRVIFVETRTEIEVRAVGDRRDVYE